MREMENWVSSVIAANGGSVVGRIRLQKIFYLLDQLGINSGFEYEYHHYGPFSDELASAVEDAKAFGLVKETYGRRAADGAKYSIFSSSKISDEVFSDLNISRSKSALGVMSKYSATVLELAATIHWLKFAEGLEQDWQEELVRRKGPKTDGGRTELASTLLQELHLA